MNHIRQFSVTMILVLASTFTEADVYRWVDAQGNVEYSDQPREGAEKIEVREPATISMPKLSDIPATQSAEPVTVTDLYNTLAITFPQDNSAFHSGNGELTVLMEVNPPLYPNHSLRISMDGAIAGTTKANFLKLTNVDRGTHVLKLDIIDNSSVVKDGPSVTFTIHRPTVQ